MKTILTVLAIVLMASIASASPFLVSDPSAQAVGGKFEIQEGGVTILSANNMSDGSIRADLAAISTGAHSYKVRYVVTDPVWGTQTSAYVPFDFTRPSLATGNITGLKLAP
jgi:hypothetical protein